MDAYTIPSNGIANLIAVLIPSFTIDVFVIGILGAIASNKLTVHSLKILPL